MKDIFSKLKQHYQIILWTIVIYQIFITIITYTQENMTILFYILMYVACLIIYKEYKDSILNFFKNKTKEIKDNDND